MSPGPDTPPVCQSQPCQNGGTCLPLNDNSGYTCICSTGFTGTFCEQSMWYFIVCWQQYSKKTQAAEIHFIATDPCNSQPCINGGTCVSANGAWTCTCPTGFSGLTCQTRNLNKIQFKPSNDFTYSISAMRLGTMPKWRHLRK